MWKTTVKDHQIKQFLGVTVIKLKTIKNVQITSDLNVLLINYSKSDKKTKVVKDGNIFQFRFLRLSY